MAQHHGLWGLYSEGTGRAGSLADRHAARSVTARFSQKGVWQGRRVAEERRTPGESSSQKKALQQGVSTLLLPKQGPELYTHGG